MSFVRRLAKNAVFLYGSHFINSLLGFFLFISIARILGDTTLGKYSFALAFTGIFAIIVEFGLSGLTIRDVAKDKTMAGKYVGNIIIIRAILSLIAIALIVAIVNVADYPPDTKLATIILGLYVVFTSLAHLFRAIIRAFERMELEALALVVAKIVTVSFGLSALFLGYGLIEVALAFLIGSVVDLAISGFICLRKFAKPKLSIDIEFWKYAIKVSLPIVFISVASVIFIRIDTVMLSSMQGDAVVGWYNAAYNMVLTLQAIPSLYGAVFLPVMSQAFAYSRSLLINIYQRSVRYLFSLGLPMAVGITLLADRFISLFYGEGFEASAIALRILAWDIPLYFLYFVLGQLLFAMNRQNRMAVATGICAVLNIVLNLILIPELSYEGAGIATITTEVVLLGLYLYFTSKYLVLIPLHKIIFKPVVACAIMATAIYFLRHLNLALLIVIAVVLYFTVLIIVRGITKEDIRLLDEAIGIPSTIRKWIDKTRGN